jgi:prepilin-type N-terminal cleavage/methylation domain-containing protein
MKKINNRKGFTIIELIIVIIIMGIVAGLTLPFIMNAVDSWFVFEANIDDLFSARLALSRMTREMRQLKSPGSITTFTSTQFSFTDINDNSISFQQSGASLLRNSDELTDNLQDPGGLTFTYLDSDGNITSVKTDIRMAKIKIVLETGNGPLTVESLARFRNL